MKRLFICPYFGKLPDWFDQWIANMQHLKPLGYDYLIETNLKLFKQRVRDTLGIEPEIEPETGKPWDYRPMLGVMYAKELEGYDYWGHTDFDVVYGDVSRYEPKDYDIWSNHHNYICGFWTLYKNNEYVNNLFKLDPNWKKYVSSSKPNGWAEMGFTSVVDREYAMERLKRVYTYYQAKDNNDDSKINYKDGRLYDGEDEIMTFHFRHTKRHPIQRYEI